MIQRKRKCIIIDVDGTIALRSTGKDARGPFDWDRVDEDNPNDIVIETIRALRKHYRIGVDFIVVTGRSDACKEQTESWLKCHDIPYDELYMRKHGDFTADALLKSLIYEHHIKPYYDVLAVFDDRDSVVAMWRNEHNLPVFQVNYGNF